MAFQDVLDKIANDIIDNTDRLITPAVLRGVLNDIAQWAQDDKVDKVTGKGLSEEDFTTILLNKLNGIEPGAEVNEVSASDLNNYIQKNSGIELEGGKIALLATGDFNDLKTSGFFRGNNLINRPVKSGQSAWDFIIVLRHTDLNFVLQIAVDFNKTYLAYRTSTGAGWKDWSFTLNETDKTELLGKINKLSIENIDLNDPAIWTPSTKTLDLSSKVGVGILNFNTPAPTYTLSDISVSTQATATFSTEEDGINLIQEGSIVEFSGILGDGIFTQLNSGTYISRNVDYPNRKFDIRKSDDLGWIDTSFSPIVAITNISSAAQAVVTVADGHVLQEDQQIQIKDAFGMEILNGNDYVVKNLDPGAGTFDLVEANTLNPVDTQGDNYISGGEVGNIPTYTVSGSASLENDIVSIKVEKIEGLENGNRLKFIANEDNKIDFVKEPLVSAAPNEIVGSEALILEENKIFKLLRNKNFNWMKQEFEAS